MNRIQDHFPLRRRRPITPIVQTALASAEHWCDEGWRTMEVIMRESDEKMLFIPNRLGPTMIEAMRKIAPVSSNEV